MQTCFHPHLSYLMNDAEAPANQSYTEDLLEFAADTHLLTFDIPEHRDLNTSLELNRQLHTRLRRKQEEISALRDANAQLRKLAEQAEHYSTILEVFTTSHPREMVSHPREIVSHHVMTSTPKTKTETTEVHSTASPHSWLSLLTQEDQSEPSLTDSTSTDPTSGVKRQLWSSWSDLLCEEAGGEDAEDCEIGCKRLRLDDELVELDLEQLEAQLDQNKWTPQQPGEESDPSESLEVSSKEQVTPVTEMGNMFGAFRGLRVITETPFVKSHLGETNGVCFKISIREHSTVKTRVFPHGKAFTSHTPSGSCRFLWVPSED